MDFGIFSPKYGISDGVPGVLLSPAFIGDKTRNMFMQDELYKHLPGRLPSLYDADGVQIACPKYVYAITAVSQAGKKFTILGNYAANFDDLTTMRVMSSTGNDQVYTLDTVTDAGANTEIVVVEVVADATVDGNLFVDTTPVLKFHKHSRDATGTDYLLLYTAYHILLWSYTGKTLTVKFTSATPASVLHWSTASLADKVYATNNVDKVQVYDIGTSLGNSFGDLENAAGLDVGGGNRLTKAKYLIAFEGYLFVGATTEAGTYYGRRVRFSDASDTEEWDATSGTDAGVRDMDQTAGLLTGFSTAGTLLIIGKEDHIILGRLTNSDTVFDWDMNSIKRGVVTEDSMIEVRGSLYFMAPDKLVYELSSPDPVMLQAEKTLRSISDDTISLAKGTYMSQYNQIWYAVATGTNTANNAIISYDLDTGNLAIHDIPVVAFGQYTQQESYTYTTLPYDTFAEWGVAWLFQYNSPLNAAGTALALASNTAGLTFELNRSNLDAGVAFESTLAIKTSLTQGMSLNEFKRCSDRIEVWVNAQGAGDLTLSVLLDGGKTVYGLGTISVVASNKDYTTLYFPADIRFKSAEFRITSTSMIEFIGMMFINFEMDGYE